MIVVMTLMFLLYLQLGIIYRNLSWFSMFSAFLLGLIFFFSFLMGRNPEREEETAGILSFDDDD